MPKNGAMILPPSSRGRPWQTASRGKCRALRELFIEDGFAPLTRDRIRESRMLKGGHGRTGRVERLPLTKPRPEATVHRRDWIVPAAIKTYTKQQVCHAGAASPFFPSMRNPTALFALLVLASLPAAFAAVPTATVSDRWVDHVWDASWIAPAEVPAREYGVYHFRKAFDLAEKPAAFVIHLSADNRYRLFANGRAVHIGPERGDLQHWGFDSLDIADFLHAGENVLAVQVWNFGIEAPVAQISEQTALIIQGDSPREAVINTDASWQAVANPAYSPITGVGARLQTYIVVGPGDRVDGSKYPWGWELPDYDDAAWPKSVVLRRGQPRGTSTDGKWLLVPRIIPLMEEGLVRLRRVRRVENADVHPGFLAGTAPVTIAPHTLARILLDQDELTTAYPELRVSDGAGSAIKLTYAESLYEGALADMSRVKGHRDAIEGKHVRGFEDIFRPDGGRDRLFRPLRWRTYRYLELEIQTAGEPLTLESLAGEFTAYPFVERASFASSDPALGRIWEIAWRTIRTGSHDVYTDSPYYEQLSYVGDTRIEALVSLYVSGDDRLMRKSIQRFDDSRNANGLTSSRYPDSRHQLIPPYSLVWISMVHDYLRLRDDPAFVESFLPGVREVLRYFREHSDPSTGSYTGRKWWNYVDWKPEWGDDPVVELGGVPPRDADGVSAILDLQHVYTLQQARDLFAVFGHVRDAEQCEQLAQKIRANILARCWDEARGLLADTPEKKTFSQHANSYLILTAEEDAPQLRDVAVRMLEDKSLTSATLYFSYYTHRALIAAGLGDRYLDQLDLWRGLLDQGLTTLPEIPGPASRSDSHAWGAHPVLEMLATVCGIEPAEIGFRSVRIAPHLGSLEFARGAVPHPQGMIEVDLKKTGGHGLAGQVILPAGLSGVFEWNDQMIPLVPGTNAISLRRVN